MFWSVYTLFPQLVLQGCFDFGYYFVQNDTDSSLIFTSGSGGVTYTLVTGRDAAIFVDGSDEVHNALANLDVTTINGIDPSNSATKGFATAMAIAL